MDLGQLGNTVDNYPNGITEHLFDVCDGILCILHYVMQQRTDQCIAIQL